jgi:hypothetical protein
VTKPFRNAAGALLISGLALVPNAVWAQQSPPPSIVWCLGAAEKTLPPANAQQATFGKAWTALCQGKFAAARDAFASILSYRVWMNDGSWGIDTQRGYFYSLIASGDDLKARNFLTSVEAQQDPIWQAHEADHLFWSGNVPAAFAAYAKEAGGLEGPPDSGRDRYIDDAARSTGDMNAVIAILSKPSGATGGSTVNSLQLLMLGNAYETQRRWPEAFATWVRAASSGHAVPEYDFLDEWNLSAMEMIYYYRAHLPSGYTRK